MSFLYHVVPSVLIFLLVGWLVFRYVFSPYFITLIFPRLRFSAISPFSLRDAEFRAKPGDSVPIISVRRARWVSRPRFHLDGIENGHLVVGVHGIVLRGTTEQLFEKDKDEVPLKPPKPSKMPDWVRGLLVRIASRLLHICIHTNPILIRLVSFNFTDIRIIVDDLDTLELSIRGIRLGAKVEFDDVDLDPVQTPDFRRGNPLLVPDALSPVSSPPTSPITFTSLNPFTASPTSSPKLNGSPGTPPRGRFGHYRRSASVHYSRVSNTAGQVWSRAIGRAHGHVAFVCIIQDISVVLPDVPAPPPVSVRPSIPDLREDGLRHRLSIKSLAESLRPDRTYAVPNDSGGDRLLELSGDTTIKFNLGFSPKKGLMGEDTLETSVEFGKLHADIAAVKRVTELLELKLPKRKKVERPKRNQWSPTRMPRIIMRAFQSVTFEFEQILIDYHLPRHTGSLASSSTEVSNLLHNHYTLSLEVTTLSLSVSAADSSNNERARNAFGTNYSPSSRVRGMGIAVDWDAIGINCLGPGEETFEQTQLLTLREASLRMFSSWRPTGWTREELLFPNDPNLALLIGRGDLRAIDFQADIQLLSDLANAVAASRSPREVPEAEPSRIASLLPRIRMVMDVGHCMAIVADRASEHGTTLTLETSGVHWGAFTSYEDIVATRRDVSASKEVFAEEEELFKRRQAAANEFNHALPTAVLRPNLRRNYNRSTATLPHDLDFSMRFDPSLSIEPLTLQMTINTDDHTQQDNFRLLQIGRIHGTAGGDIYGRTTYDHGESSSLDPSTLCCGIDLGIDHGIKVDLWQPAVISHLEAMGSSVKSLATSPSAPSKKDLLQVLPSGISARISLGLVSVFLAHEDPNPDAHGLIRGMWVQLGVTLEYAYFENDIQIMPRRHPMVASKRAKLRLPDEGSSQAIAQHISASANGGRAALVKAHVTDIIVKPIANGEKFAALGGTSMTHQHIQPLVSTATEPEPCWEFRLEHPKKNLAHGEFANSEPPFDLNENDQVRQPLLRIPSIETSWIISRPADAPVEHRVEAKIDEVTVMGDQAHIYLALLAAQTTDRLVKAWKKPSRKAKKTLPIALSISIPNISIRFMFPLKEEIILLVKGAFVKKNFGVPWSCGAEGIDALVPSRVARGRWETLGRIKKLSVGPDKEGRIGIVTTATRIRIPVAYELCNLILNANVTVKALKVLLLNLRGELPFHKIHMPDAEEPKRVPPMRITFGVLLLEAKDDPLETKLNLIMRVGAVEQEYRNRCEDAYEEKLHKLEDPSESDSDDGGPRLTHHASVPTEEARCRLDEHLSQSWVRRIRGAASEQQRREAKALRSLQSTGEAPIESSIPIPRVNTSLTVPLFRGVFTSVVFDVAPPDKNREEIIQYMGELSSPFRHDEEFSLMVPIRLGWSMGEARLSLRDYPLPLIHIPPVEKGEIKPAFFVETDFIIAEELVHNGLDSIDLVPTLILPEGCGGDVPAFSIQVCKTVMPVKTYTRSVIKIASKRTTEFTWGNSYSPAISDLMRVIETLSRPPRDPSPRIGFWDKFRLILHWRVTVDFTGTVHLHMKGSSDPYKIEGDGAGFALAFQGGTQLRIRESNKEYETIQLESEKLLVAIPDLTKLRDEAAIGSAFITRRDSDEERMDEPLVNRPETKPCATFQNGVRVGFGFVFERTCRPHNCVQECGDDPNLFNRQCRFLHATDFVPHQDVIMRTEQAVHADSKRFGRPADSYENFRSDYIHFSVSLVNTRPPDQAQPNSFHFSPVAFAHFFNWWGLFDHRTSPPIRQGKLFEHMLPPSKKFGKSLGTLKYRADLGPVYLSHMYNQVNQALWDRGKGEALGIKLCVDHIRADAHQRQQLHMARNEKLGTTRREPHKPFYAVDIVADNLQVKAIRAIFTDLERPQPSSAPDLSYPKASELSDSDKQWFNNADFIDADKAPFDMDPRVEIVTVADCPQLALSKRVKARHTQPGDTNNDIRHNVETSKFGHEKSHICMLNDVKGVAAKQMELTEARIAELEHRVDNVPQFSVGFEQADTLTDRNRLKILRAHLEKLKNEETRHVDTETLVEGDDDPHKLHHDKDGTTFFETTIYVHNPRITWNNKSRNCMVKYFFSSLDRKRDEYLVSHNALRSVRDGILQRIDTLGARNWANDAIEIDTTQTTQTTEMLQQLEGSLAKRGSGLFQLSSDAEGWQRPTYGLPQECSIKAEYRVLMLKPQIALRSDRDDDAIMLLAVEEISFERFKVTDDLQQDMVSAELMSRNYISLKGLQTFYPTDETIRRHRGPFKTQRYIDFVPLETFLDVRSEANDFDRIVLKTDMFFSLDRFNSLRVPRGINWPDIVEPDGSDVSHLRIHQDLTTAIIPRITVTGTSRHWTALWYIVTDLIAYEDPDRKARAEKIESFMLAFDRKDRDPQLLLINLQEQQLRKRALDVLRLGYERNHESLDDSGKANTLLLRHDGAALAEILRTVFQGIQVNFKRDDARASLISSSRLDVRFGGITWHMLHDDLSPLAKTDIDGALFSSLTNKDSSVDSAAVISELSILNSNADAEFPEILVRLGPKSKKDKKAFISSRWSIAASVGGIQIWKHFGLYPTSMNIRIEEKVGREVWDYILNDRVKKPSASSERQSSDEHRESNGERNSGGQLTRTKSANSVSTLATTATTNGGRSFADETRFTMVPMEDAVEMRRRATTNKNFMHIELSKFKLCLTYANDPDRHRRLRFPDCYDIELESPRHAYHNMVGGISDVMEAIKKDTISALMSQGSSLFKQLFVRTSIFRSKNAIKRIAANHTEAIRAGSKNLALTTSKLRMNIEPPPEDKENGSPATGGSLARAWSGMSNGKSANKARTPSREYVEGTHSPRDMGNGSSATLGVALSDSPDKSGSTSRRSEDSGSEEEKSMGKAMKGILGKMRPRLGRGDSEEVSPEKLRRSASR